MSQSLIIRKSSGTSLTIIRTGANSGGTAYVLPPANATTLGGVQIGEGITVAANGLIEVTYAGLSDKPDLTVYLTTATANSTYQPKGNYLTAANLTFANLTGKPTTLAGYGITDAYPLSGNPSGFLLPSNLTVYAPLANPAFTGTPTAPTAANGTASTQLATTQFVKNALSTGGSLAKTVAISLIYGR